MSEETMTEQDRSSSGKALGPLNPIVVIPARMASTRLPGKPLADLAGEPMIVHVWRRAMEADIGPVIIASGDPEISAAVEQAGGQAVLTRSDHPSGSDRVYEAITAVDPAGKYDAIINLQGDLPLIDATAIRLVCAELAPGDGGQPDMTTLAAEITDPAEATNPNVVKAIVSLSPGAQAGSALYFTRATAPSGDGPLYHHIGIYGYRRDALERFVSLPPSPLEKRERLEQLRALEAGMRIRVGLVDTVPFGVDTPDDLDRARELIGTE